MERNLGFVKALERVTTTWAPQAVVEQAAKIEAWLVHFANPDTLMVTPPTASFLMSGFLSAATLTVFYLTTIFLLAFLMKTFFKEGASGAGGKKPMSTKRQTLTVSRKFQQEPILILAAVYNVVQVVLCTYMAGRAAFTAYNAGYSFVCNKFDLRDDLMGKVHWVFYMSKVLDFGDTYLIVLRRKWRQLSFLHVYHHASIYFLSWLNLRTAFDGDMYYTIVANSSIHAIMYSYYLLRTFNISVPGVMKMMVTNMQMIQFVTMLSQAVYMFANNCPYPRRMLLLYFGYVCTLLLLFMDFANTTYGKKQGKRKKN